MAPRSDASIRPPHRRTVVRALVSALLGLAGLAGLGAAFTIGACAGHRPEGVAHGINADAAASAGPSSEHDQALSRLVVAPWATRLDKRRTIAFPLPDGDQWTHVKFFGVTTLAGWRYGDDHHAVAAAFTFAPGGESTVATVDRCAAKFIAWGQTYAKAFDLAVSEPRVEVVPWPAATGDVPGTDVKIFVLDAERRSVLGTARYPSAFAVYPAWVDACLVIGVSVPEDDAKDAYKLRDRLVRDALSSLVAKPGRGQLALEAKLTIE